VANASGEQDALEREKVRVLDEIFRHIPTDKIAKLVIDADFVGLVSSAVDGVEVNAFGGTAKKGGRDDGMNSVGFIEVTDEQCGVNELNSEISGGGGWYSPCTILSG